jgi:hypothetical protein
MRMMCDSIRNRKTIIVVDAFSIDPQVPLLLQATQGVNGPDVTSAASHHQHSPLDTLLPAPDQNTHSEAVHEMALSVLRRMLRRNVPRQFFNFVIIDPVLNPLEN